MSDLDYFMFVPLPIFSSSLTDRCRRIVPSGATTLPHVLRQLLLGSWILALIGCTTGDTQSTRRLGSVLHLHSRDIADPNPAWRVPFILQWFWVLILPPGVLFAPEAPYWLVRKGRYDDAHRVVVRLQHEKNERAADQQVALMRYTTTLEKAEVAGASFRDCFRGTNLRRTEIVSVVAPLSIEHSVDDDRLAWRMRFNGFPETTLSLMLFCSSRRLGWT